MTELDLYDYDLPRARIAQEPLATRSDARLMLVDRQTGKIDHFHVRDLPDLLRPDDIMVMNNSRVMPARLVGHRTATRGRWQGLFLQADDETGVWEVLTKTRGKLQIGETITIEDRNGRDGMHLRVLARLESGNLIVRPELPAGYVLPEEWSGRTFTSPPDWLDLFGRVPLPPYIRDGQMVDADVQQYQTVYAKTAGSIAAPTAGLHFTKPLLDQLSKRGIEQSEVTLHVGLGTFRPIKADRLDEHKMHSEWGSIDESTAQRIQTIRQSGGRCVAVGTTTVRVLESAASQTGTLQAWSGHTDLFIRPPYQFQCIDALMTNFHLPRSTLLVLVSAFAGRDLTLRAYREAVDQEYRFYSYGDAMLIV